MGDFKSFPFSSISHSIFYSIGKPVTHKPSDEKIEKN